VTADVGGRRDATFELVSGVTTVVVRTAGLGSRLYRAWTPADSGLTPRALVTGDVVRLSLRNQGGVGDSSVLVELNPLVRWRISLDGGAANETVDLAGARLSGLTFGAGSSRIEATLPAPVGTAVVRMTGGAGVFDVHLPSGVPASVHLAGGAGRATVDGIVHNGIAGGTVFTTPGWDVAVNRYTVDNVAGVSALTIDHA
jgi:hypothetical protein